MFNPLDRRKLMSSGTKSPQGSKRACSLFRILSWFNNSSSLCSSSSSLNISLSNPLNFRIPAPWPQAGQEISLSLIPFAAPLRPGPVQLPPPGGLYGSPQDPEDDG